MERDRAITRRVFAAGLVGLTAKAERPVTGSFVNDAFPIGHRLRDRATFATPSKQVRIPIVIVGGGIAGLSAAWRLDKRGFRDFVVLEMEPEAGGNARWGENDVSRYPWAAHYVPVPSRKSVLVRELFEELGVLRDGKWDDRMLCFAPQERLFLHGRWQDGIEPDIGMAARDREQFRRFDALMAEYRASGEFAIPLESAERRQGSQIDGDMQSWMAGNGFDSSYLRWYVNYACRDDYGASMRDTSAWAGIHYFASREPEDKGPLTWPEGNGWITRQLLKRLGRYVRVKSPVYRIAHEGRRLRVFTETAEYVAEAVVFATPTFLAPYVIERAGAAEGFVYSPWLTANLTLEHPPQERETEPAWDNVIYDSPALGYVNATHMSLASQRERNVWTYYWSFAGYTPEAARRMLLDKDWSYWKEAILNDLGRAHPDIRQCVSRVDIMRMGHAMIRPTPGFLTRRTPVVPQVYFANSDLSGISIFEEAQYHGVDAAERALKAVSRG
jgi:glycine/D-amino acid oxidase-like deaminating enzyme